MKIIHKLSGQIREIESIECKVTFKVQENQFENSELLNEYVEIEKQIIIDKLLNSDEYEEFIDEWKYNEWNFRVSGNGRQAIRISKDFLKAAAIYAELGDSSEVGQNPFETFGEDKYFRIYCNNFAPAGILKELLAIGCTIEARDAEAQAELDNLLD